jgi:undecaprenyl pyrophosphate phosphatase UppP
MDPVLIPVVAIVFSMSIPIAAIIIDYFNRKSKMKVIEKAIEKGVTLEGLSLEDKKRPRMPYRAGMVVLAVGIGIGILGILIGQTDREALYPLLGAGSIPALVGIALIINDRINYNRYFNKESDRQ